MDGHHTVTSAYITLWESDTDGIYEVGEFKTQVFFFPDLHVLHVCTLIIFTFKHTYTQVYMIKSTPRRGNREKDSEIAKSVTVKYAVVVFSVFCSNTLPYCSFFFERYTPFYYGSVLILSLDPCARGSPSKIIFTL